MRFKLDGNIGRRGRDLLATAGHDVSTVAEQSLAGAEDAELIEVCRAEDRCLVTLDLDFSNPLAFVPSRYAGIAVLRLTGFNDESLSADSREELERRLRSIASDAWYAYVPFDGGEAVFDCDEWGVGSARRGGCGLHRVLEIGEAERAGATCLGVACGRHSRPREDAVHLLHGFRLGATAP